MKKILLLILLALAIAAACAMHPTPPPLPDPALSTDWKAEKGTPFYTIHKISTTADTSYTTYRMNDTINKYVNGRHFFQAHKWPGVPTPCFEKKTNDSIITITCTFLKNKSTFFFTRSATPVAKRNGVVRMLLEMTAVLVVILVLIIFQKREFLKWKLFG